MLIAMIILGIILVPLTTSFVMGLGTAARSQQDLTNSTDLQAFAAFFSNDVGNADIVKTGSAPCGASGTAVVEFDWTDGTADNIAAYVAVEDTTMESDLHRTPVYRLDRVTCVDGSNTAQLVLARSVSAIPVAQCDGSPCTSNSTPLQVALPVDEYGAAVSDPHFTFTANATRRVTTP